MIVRREKLASARSRSIYTSAMKNGTTMPEVVQRKIQCRVVRW